MPLYKFDQSDVFHNRVEAHPRCNFFFYSGSSYHNNRPKLKGAFVTSTPGVLPGHVSLYELNVDRVSGSTEAPDIIYSFIYKDSNSNRFRAVNPTTLDGSTALFSETAEPGTMLTASYPLSASIKKDYLAENHVSTARSDIVAAIEDNTIVPDTDIHGYPVKSTLGSKISALKNTLNSYTYLSKHYAYDSGSYDVDSLQSVFWDKGKQEMGLLSIPSIFYGRRIKKGTVDLKFYITGALVGQLKDERNNGELVQVGPDGSNGSGSIAGVVLYNEGFVLLTGSWDLTKAATAMGPPHTERYLGPAGGATSPRWIDFAQSIATGSISVLSSSFELNFSGTTYVPTITMMAHARKGHLNFSNNPTYIKHGQTTAINTGSNKYRQFADLEIKNIVSSSYQQFTASYKKQTYISKIGIYDEKKNLIGIAKVATPVKKTEDRDFTFKIKLDI